MANQSNFMRGRYFLWGLVLLGCSSAHADYFSSWVATVCDPDAGVAAVRFGYADADDPPLFVNAAPTSDPSLWALPVTNASQREASCRLPSGREVKVRLGTGYDYQGDQFSIWVDRIRILHGEIGEHEVPFAVEISQSRFRVCAFDLQRGDLYAVTGKSPPRISCQATSSPVSGTRDLIEYPPNPAPKALPGSISVSGEKSQLCSRMIARVGDVVGKLTVGTYQSADDQAIVATKLGTVINWTDFRDVSMLPDSGDPVARLSMLSIDFWSMGKAVSVYLFSSGGTYPEQFLVLPPSDVTDDDVVRMAGAEEWEHIESQARTKGWIVFSGRETPYNPRANLEVDLVRARSATYLLFHSDQDHDPLAVMVQPHPDGSAQTICSFRRVAPHF